MPLEVFQGDLVQWESQGSFMFAEARRVERVDAAPDGSLFVFVEQSTCGIPADQVKVVERGGSYYGNWISGCWSCTRCAGTFYPRQLKLFGRERPFTCPFCGGGLEYSEFD